MSEAFFEWRLSRGGRLLFIARADGLFDLDHYSRGDDSCGRVAIAVSRAEAEAAAHEWLREAGQYRVDDNVVVLWP